MRMQGKVSVVTGAATGIGRAIAERLADEGAVVLCADVDGDGVRAAAAAIEDARRTRRGARLRRRPTPPRWRR